MKRILILLVLPFFLLSACTGVRQSEKLTVPDPEPVQQGVFSNPVLDINFPDPTVIKAPDGAYYVYATNSSVHGKLINIQVHRSEDLVNWESLGDALPQRPQWGDKDFWAPHVFFDEEQQTYFLYYSGESIDEGAGKCLGVATSKNPEGPFVDMGTPLLCGEGFVNIDPMVYEDPETNKKLLYWGSGFEPIKVQELSKDGLSFNENSSPIELVFPLDNEDPENYQRLVEGPWVTRRGDYYYLYYSGDNCCGEQAHYAAMVARSKNATGPFETLEEAEGRKSSVILEKKGRWIAPGHNSVIRDEAGEDWMVYHAIDSTDPGKGRVMLIDKIVYKNGWPAINGGFPSAGVQSLPAVE